MMRKSSRLIGRPGLWPIPPVFLTFAMLLLAPPLARAQVPPQLLSSDLVIASPADGTRVQPGQALTVTVSVAPGSSFSAVQVIGEEMGFSDVKSSPPFDFQLMVPNTHAGARKLTAVGLLGPGGQALFSNPITVEIETQALLQLLTPDVEDIAFDFPGDQVSLSVTGSFDDGSERDITKSSLTTYSSNDPDVAVADQDGRVTAVGPGTASITVSYASTSADVAVTVPQSAPGDLNADGRADNEDLKVLKGALDTPATGAFDVRDFNGDGQIDDIDVQALLGIIGSSADLAITTVSAAGAAVPGATIVYTITIANNGPDAAEYVLLDLLFPRSASFVASTASQGDGECDGALTHARCDLGVLAGGAQATVTITLAPTRQVDIETILRLSSSVPDSNEGNNLTSAVTEAPPAPALNSYGFLLFLLAAVPVAVLAWRRRTKSGKTDGPASP